MGYTDEYILEAITPNKIIRYLKENNWHMLEDFSNSPNYLFARNDDDFKQLSIPKKKGSTLSYGRLILDVIFEISNDQNLSRDVVISNITNVDKYIINIRYSNPTIKNYNIPASALYELLENSKKLYLNSFSDTNLKDLNTVAYRRGKFPEVVQFIDNKLEFGQTTTGSYVIPMLIPKEDSNFELHDGDLFENQNFDFEKETGNIEVLDTTGKAVINMIEKINVVKNIIDGNSDLNEVIDPKSDRFISVDYLNALSNIGDDNDNTIIEFSTTIMKSSRPNNIMSSFTYKYKQHVNKFVDDYKKMNKIDNVFTGKLYKLTLDKTDVIDRKTLIVNLEGQSATSGDSKIQKLICEFEYEVYKDIIFNAIEKGLTVKVIGIRSSNKLLNCSAEIIEPN